ncbi:hypothetical protein [Spirillospora sp. CA-128828]|uniref:hypothetical protein n=1 Tax=Spirillospora sp. CA-128828 TaxID=3240033 RepID=UPI003D930D62
MLRWKTTLQTRNKNSFKIFQAFTMDTEDQLGLDQRDRSHPERVADLRDFLLRLRSAPEVPPVLIAIDELDKIASAEKAIEAVNGLKDLFHITETHFVVSVSEDALDSFALRGVPVRDAFDSSFDTVMRVRPLTAGDSWTLLRRRASLFNEWAALLCHVIAGGLPRDLVRAARHCVELCNRNDGPIPVTDLAARLVKEETAEVIEAAIRRVRSEGVTSRWLMSTRQKIETADRLSALPLDSLFAGWTAGSQTSGAMPAPTVLEANVGVFLLIMVTVAELFEVPRNATDWRAFATESGNDLERLAAARAALTVSHVDALERLIAIRASTRLTDLPPDLVDSLNHTVPPAGAD